jgi:hypothetical protein
MNLKNEFKKMITGLSEKFDFPPVARFFTPPFHRGGQPKDAQFIALGLEGGAVGISFVHLPDEKEEEYTTLRPSDFVGEDPGLLARGFGEDDAIGEMLGIAAVNAICQHVMRVAGIEVDHATDSLGLLSVSRGDRIGMIGLFSGLIRTIEQAGADLVIIEKNERLMRENPDLPITPDMARLGACNKILSTSTTVLNNTLDEVLSHCSPDAFVAVIGPTAGYFPDPLFARGVDVVGGRVVKNADLFFQRISAGSPWGDAACKTCFQKKTYGGLSELI